MSKFIEGLIITTGEIVNNLSPRKNSMLCLNCSFQNPDDAKFCQNCGQPLERICKNCGTLNAPTAKFCKNCGTNLREQPAPEQDSLNLSIDPTLHDPRHALLAASAPRQLADKMRAATHLAGERRVVTTLFADVVGSTALAEQMDPEDWTVIMNRAFDVLVPVIYRYEGTLARLMGDALLAFFGAPVAHEDDPVRAVHAGLDLLAAAREYNEVVRRRHGIEFTIRVGLNTGLVVVGQVGSDLVYEYTAMGDAVNLAARIQSAAQPMSVLISENTYRFVATAFECQDQGEISLKGKRVPVRVHMVSGVKTRSGRTRGVGGLQSTMVGRQSELEKLLDLSAMVSVGVRRGVVIVGEAGLGKSRLVAEWKAILANPTNNPNGKKSWLEGQCLSYGQSLAYHLVTEILRNIIGEPVSADEVETRASLQRRCENILGKKEAESVFPYLAHMLSLNVSGEAQERVRNLDPQTLQSQYLIALRKLLSALAEQEPLMLVLEDIHWADPSSIELLINLLPLSTRLPVLFCVISRPDREAPGWKLINAMRERLGASLAEINLQALKEEDARQLVSNLLEVDTLPESARKIILEKAEGNPYFVEEVIRTLIEQGAIKHQAEGWQAMGEIGQIDLPDTLQGLLLARIDRLQEEVKRTIRTASVLGRQFSLRVLEEMFKHNSLASRQGSSQAAEPSLVNHLNSLESLGLLNIAQLKPELEYSFRHAMVHEVAYQSLVKRDRQTLHLAAGEALERLFPDRLNEFAARLGTHFEEGKDESKAVKYLSAAGDNANRQNANEEAWSFYRRGIKIYARMPALEEAQIKQLIHMYTRGGRTLELIGRYEQAQEVYQELEAQAQQRKNKAMELAALVACTVIYSTPSPVFDVANGDRYAAKALSLAEQTGDQAAEAKIHWALILHYSIANQMDKAREHGERSLALARKLDLRKQLAFTLSDLANFVYMEMGEFETSLQALEEAQNLWHELGNLPLLSNCIVYIGYVYYFMGRYEAALQKTNEAYRISQSINNSWGMSYSRGTSAFVQLELGNAYQVKTLSGEAMRMIEQSGFAVLKPITLITLAKLHFEMGAIEEAHQLAVEGMKEVENEFQFWLPVALGVLAEIQIQMGVLAAAEETIGRARKISQMSGAFMQIAFTSMAESKLALSKEQYQAALEISEKFYKMLMKLNGGAYMPYALYDMGRALLALGRTAEAEGAFSEGSQVAEEQHSRFGWWRCLAALAEVSSKRGGEAEAQAYREQARGVIEFIAEHAGSEALRKSFLSLPKVQGVMSS